jgi:predicted permease
MVWTRIRLWLASLLDRQQFNRDLADELAFHIDARAEDLARRGLSAAEARRQARLEFGAPDKYAEQVREARAGIWVEQLRQDLHYAVRVLIRRPAFTIAALLTLSLGTGATAAVFGLLDRVLLRALPVSHPEELAHIYTSCRAGDPYCAGSYPEYLDYRAQNRTFADVAAFEPIGVSVGNDSGSWVGTALLVSTNYFTLLGIAPHAGQLISPGWNVSADPPVVLAHDTWVAHFGGDRAAIGRTLRISDATFRIAGVAPPAFRGTRLEIRPDLWLAIDNIGLIPHGGSDPGTTARPSGSDMLTNRGRRWIGGTIGRLRPGATIEQARADLRAISDGLQQTDPDREGRFVTVEPAERAALPAGAASDVRRFLVLLMGGVTATLLIACANVAGLLLARGAARRPEIELRRALGAGRARLVRQLMAEHLLLASIGTALGLLVAKASMALLASYDLPGALPSASLDLQLDGRVLLFAVLLLGITGLFGLIPALGTTRGLAATTASRTTGDGTGRTRGQGLLLASQVTITTILLVGAGLFIRSLQNGLNLNLGLSSRSVVMAQLMPALGGYTPARTQVVVDDALARLGALPDLDGVTAARLLPLTRGNGFRAQQIDGYSPRADEEMRFTSNFVAPGYFGVLGIARRAGREFTGADRSGAPLVGVISETMARRYWAGRDPIGTHIHSQSFPEPIRIVGVVGDVTTGLDHPSEPCVYLSLAQHPRFLNAPVPMVLLARARTNPAALAASMRRVLHGIDPALPVTDVAPLDDRIADLLMPQRLGSMLLSALGCLTVVLVTVGAAGTVAYGVSRRRREIGVRLALGARRAQVAGTMTRGALASMVAGVVAGSAMAAALGRSASAFLYGIEPTDAVSFAAAGACLALATGIASFLPAWRAAGVDPGEILKAE